MPAGPRGIAESLKVTLGLLAPLLGHAHLVELSAGEPDSPRLAEDRNLQQTCVDSAREVGDGLEQRIGLSDLVRGLLKAALGSVDASVALVDVFLHIAHVVVVEAVFAALLRGGEAIVFDL